ncbi:MAG: hypothetical protein HC913_07140 [Microscillaceae bacterium]|nr:hypothetical protein [Microscillaceae bacterium]
MRAWEPSELGWKVIINDTYHGLVYHSEIFRPLEVGAICPGYIQTIRPDGKIDVRLRPPGFAHIADESQRLLAILQARSGFLALHDKSPADAIAETLHMSKKTFKKAVGILYKQGLLSLEEEGIRLRQS